MTTLEVGKKLVDLCTKMKWSEALETLYHPNIVSTEAASMPNMPARQEGIKALRAKTEWWEQNHDVHSCEVRGPWPHGDRFIVTMKIDVTPKSGPKAGKRGQFEEACLYTVKEGKIVEEAFFYTMDM